MNFLKLKYMKYLIDIKVTLASQTSQTYHVDSLTKSSIKLSLFFQNATSYKLEDLDADTTYFVQVYFLFYKCLYMLSCVRFIHVYPVCYLVVCLWEIDHRCNNCQTFQFCRGFHLGKPYRTQSAPQYYCKRFRF